MIGFVGYIQQLGYGGKKKGERRGVQAPALMNNQSISRRGCPMGSLTQRIQARAKQDREKVVTAGVAFDEVRRLTIHLQGTISLMSDRDKLLDLPLEQFESQFDGLYNQTVDILQEIEASGV